MEANASALVIINTPPLDGRSYVVYTMSNAGTQDEDFVSPIPVFNILATCGNRLEDGGRYA